MCLNVHFELILVNTVEYKEFIIVYVKFLIFLMRLFSILTRKVICRISLEEVLFTMFSHTNLPQRWTFYAIKASDIPMMSVMLIWKRISFFKENFKCIKFLLPQNSVCSCVRCLGKGHTTFIAFTLNG